MKEMTLEDVGINHFFGGGVYAKEARIPAGMKLKQHVHGHDHLSVLAVGVVDVTVDGVTKRVEAPACLTIVAGKAHEGVSITATVWYCIHASEETDPDKIDKVLIE